MPCQCRFTVCNKCSTLVGAVVVGGDCVYRAAEWEISVLSVQFCYEPKTALEKLKCVFFVCLKTKDRITIMMETPGVVTWVVNG